VAVFFLYNYFLPLEIFKKYHIIDEAWLIGLIAVNINYNNLLMHLYRINNQLSQISFYQSVVPLLMLIAVLFFQGESLLKNLILCYVLGNICSSIYFMLGKSSPNLHYPFTLHVALLSSPSMSPCVPSAGCWCASTARRCRTSSI